MYWLAKFGSIKSAHLYERSNYYISLEPLLLVKSITKNDKKYIISWSIQQKIKFRKLFIYFDGKLQYHIRMGVATLNNYAILCDGVGNILSWYYNMNLEY